MVLDEMLKVVSVSWLYAIGVQAEWIPVIQKMGYLTVDALRKLPAGKFFNDLCGFNKKNKLGLKAPSIEEVKAWCAPAAE